MRDKVRKLELGKKCFKGLSDTYDLLTEMWSISDLQPFVA